MTVTSSETPRVESFVLRFVADAPSDAASLEASTSPNPVPPARWHGVVVHVQTNQEKHFTNIADAVAFIARYVPVGDAVSPEDRQKPSDDDG
jgi:hypothetical protein